jgi:hypothetical protein
VKVLKAVAAGRRIWDPAQVTRKLAQQIAARGQDPAQVLPNLAEVETRRAVRRPVNADGESGRKYKGWLRKYKEWCPGQGYQPDPAHITDQRVVEFVHTLIDGDDPYAPPSAGQAISALLYYAGRASADPMPTGREARDLVLTYVARLRADGLLP